LVQEKQLTDFGMVLNISVASSSFTVACVSNIFDFNESGAYNILKLKIEGYDDSKNRHRGNTLVDQKYHIFNTFRMEYYPLIEVVSETGVYSFVMAI
jgi:hypothetical protein